MQHITATTARNTFDDILYNVIELGDSVSIATDTGAAIIISQQEWSGLQETLYLQSIPGFVESVIEAREAPVYERVQLEDLGWDIN